MNLIQAAELITGQSRTESRDTATWLSSRIFRVQVDAGFPLVEGEEGSVYVGEALGRLVTGRVKREGGGPVGRMEAWLQAEVVAASVAAAHELETGELVLPDEQDRLRESFAAFGIQSQ